MNRRTESSKNIPWPLANIGRGMYLPWERLIAMQRKWPARVPYLETESIKSLIKESWAFDLENITLTS